MLMLSRTCVLSPYVTVFAVIQVPPQFKSHSVPNLIFKAHIKCHTSSWIIFGWRLDRSHVAFFWLSMAGVQKYNNRFWIVPLVCVLQ